MSGCTPGGRTTPCLLLFFFLFVIQVNCAAYGCNGCGGGFGQCAFDFAIRVGYFREKDEPYRNNRFACRMREVEPLGKITSFSYVQPSMSRFTRAVRNNPLWVTLDANALQFYRSGIVTGNSSAPNHGPSFTARSAVLTRLIDITIVSPQRFLALTSFFSFGGLYPDVQR
jgi:hypothetical protein